MEKHRPLWVQMRYDKTKPFSLLRYGLTCFVPTITDSSSHGKRITHSLLPRWEFSQLIQGFESAVLYFAHNVAPLMLKLHFGWGVVVSAWGICVQSHAAVLDKAKVKQTSDWHCDMVYEHRPTANYTSQNNCSIYSPMLCCCFLPVESHRSRHRTYRMCVFPYGHTDYTIGVWCSLLISMGI